MEDIKATVKFIEKVKDSLDMFGVNVTTPYPGTELWNICLKKRLIPEKFSWSDFTQDKTSILACENFSGDELQNLVLEIFSMQKISLSRIWRKSLLWLPWEVLLWGLRHPGKTFKLLFKVVFEGRK